MAAGMGKAKKRTGFREIRTFILDMQEGRATGGVEVSIWVWLS